MLFNCLSDIKFTFEHHLVNNAYCKESKAKEHDKKGYVTVKFGSEAEWLYSKSKWDPPVLIETTAKVHSNHALSTFIISHIGISSQSIQHWVAAQTYLLTLTTMETLIISVDYARALNNAIVEGSSTPAPIPPHRQVSFARPLMLSYSGTPLLFLATAPALSSQTQPKPDRGKPGLSACHAMIITTEACLL